MNRHARRPSTARMTWAVATLCFATAGASAPIITTAATAPTASAPAPTTDGCCVGH